MAPRAFLELSLFEQDDFPPWRPSEIDLTVSQKNIISQVAVWNLHKIAFLEKLLRHRKLLMASHNISRSR